MSYSLRYFDGSIVGVLENYVFKIFDFSISRVFSRLAK